MVTLVSPEHANHWTINPGSIAILGHTQTGKTVLARQLHAENNRVSIWVNQRGDERVPDIPVSNRAYKSINGLVKGMARDERKHNLLAADPATTVSQLQEKLWAWAENSDRKLQFQVVIDELHNIAPENATKEKMDSRDAVRKMAKEGQKRGIKFIGITQDPSSLDKQTIRQTEYVVMFHNHFSQGKSLGRLDLPFNAAQQLPEHHFLVIDSKGNFVVPPTSPKKAKSKYA